MNKAMKTIMMALAVSSALCTTAMAAPKGNHMPNGRAPVAVRAQPHKNHQTSPAKHTAKESPRAHHAPARKPHHEVAKHNSPPPPVKVKHNPPPPHPHEKVCHHEPERHHHKETLHTEDWCCIGATVVGGIIGGLIGAAL